MHSSDGLTSSQVIFIEILVKQIATVSHKSQYSAYLAGFCLMATLLTYLWSALLEQKQALSRHSAPSPTQACDSSHFSTSRAYQGPDLLDMFAPPAWEQYLFTWHRNVAE